MKNRSLLYIISSVFISLTANPVMAQQYEVINLGYIPHESQFGVNHTGISVVPSDINDNRQIVGANYFSGRTGSYAFLWENGVISDLDNTVPGQEGSYYAEAINNQGQIVGGHHWYGYCSPGKAFIWDNGVRMEISGLHGAETINDLGQISGNYLDACSLSTNFRHVSVYLIDDGDRIMIGDHASINSSHYKSLAMTNNTQILIVHDGIHIWEDGVLTQIGGFTAFDMNELGDVVGYLNLGQGDRSAMVYTDGQIIDIGADLPSERSIATGINDKGEVVGSYEDETTGETISFLWKNGVFTDLSALVPSNSDFAFISASGINNNGDIIGVGALASDPQTFTRGFVMLAQAAPNTPPRIVSQPVTEFIAGQTNGYPVQAVDDDGDTLSYEITDGPSGYVIDPQSGLVTMSPLNGQIGFHSVNIRVTDGNGGEDNQSFILEIRSPAFDATLTSPAPGSEISQETVTFQWSQGTNVTNYFIGVGTTQASVANHPWGNIGTAATTSATETVISGIPLDGGTIYVRLWWRSSGVWDFTDYTYTTVDLLDEPVLTSPSSGTVLSDFSVTFQWTPGSQIERYFLGVGKSSQSVSSSPWGDIFTGTTTSTALTVNNMPLNGNDVFVRLWYLRAGVWGYTDHTFATADLIKDPEITTPSIDADLNSSSVTFSWTPGTNISEYYFGAGSTPATVRVAPYGNIFLGKNLGTALSVTVNGVPLTGAPLYVRLWWKRAGSWQFKDYIYSTANDSPAIIAPTPGATLSSSNVTFQWSAGNSVDGYFFGVGTSASATSNSPWGNIFAQSVSGTSQSVSGIPINGNPLYVRLWWKVSGIWHFTDYIYQTSSGI